MNRVYMYFVNKHFYSWALLGLLKNCLLHEINVTSKSVRVADKRRAKTEPQNSTSPKKGEPE